MASDHIDALLGSLYVGVNEAIASLALLDWWSSYPQEKERVHTRLQKMKIIQQTLNFWLENALF